MPTNKQRREAQRRHLQRQLQHRQEREARRRKVTLISSIASTVVLIAVIITVVVAVSDDSGGGKKKAAAGKSSSSTSAAASASTSPSASASRVATYPCTWTKDTTATAARTVKLPSTTTPPKTGTVTVSVKTTQGPMTITLNRAGAPCTVANFVSLVQQKYYDDTPCHRLVTSGIYVLQCGDPTGKGTGGPGYSIPDEATGKETYPAGTVAMARSSAAHSGGSQFFIVYKDSPALVQGLGQQQYTVFGTVKTGMNVVTKVAAKGTDNANGTGDGAPKLPITISSMTAATK